MSSRDIYENIEYINIYNEIDININKVTIDTRKVDYNDCYIGIKGEKNDGNDFYMEAFLKGASLVILDKFIENEEVINYLKDNNKSIIVVKDTVKVLGSIAKYKREQVTIPVVAITGSAGKTSTKDMVYSVLKEKYNAHKTIGNQNNHLGLPLTVLSLEEENEVLVLEMGMNHLGEISYLTNIAKPNVAVITNVGTAHIGLLGSRENILKAKLEILDGLSSDGILIINLDNDLLNKWYYDNKDKYNIKTIGIESDADYKATNICENEDGSTFLCLNNKYRVPVGGKHFIYNALVSIAVGGFFEIPSSSVKKGILNFELSSNRMNIIEKDDITIIDDSYNANYDSMSYAIKYLGSLEGRNIAVLGTMKELGNYSKKLHSDIGSLISREEIDILITVGEDTEFINEGAINNGFVGNSYHFDNNIDAINLINSVKRKDDNILIKASNSLKFNEIVKRISE